MPPHVNPPLGQRLWVFRIFSLFGLVPMGLYLVVHLYNNLSSIQGEEAYNRYLTESKASPLYFALMLVGFYFPLIWHTIVGLQRIKLKSHSLNYFQYSYFRNLKFWLQRLSAIGILLFIPAHVFKTRIEPYLKQHPLDYKHMVEGFHEKVAIPGLDIALPYLTIIVYVLGTLGVCYHFANGLWTASISWGIISNARTQRIWEITSLFIGLCLWTMALVAMSGFIWPVSTAI